MAGVDALSERIRGFILEKFPLARKRGLKTDDKLLESGILDSLGVLDLVAFIEQEFAVFVSDEELGPENFESAASLGAFVQSKIEAKKDGQQTQ
jgi:acyl carrier protein